MGSNPIGPIYINEIQEIIKLVSCSGGVVRPIISAFRAEDSGSNPGRSIFTFYQIYYPIYDWIMQGKAGVPELAKGDRLRTCWRRPTRVRIPAPASEFLMVIFIHVLGWGRWLSFGTVDPTTRVRISAPALL